MQNTSIIGFWCIAKKVTNEQALISFTTITLLSLCKLILATDLGGLVLLN